MKTEYNISGMTCGSCVAKVQDALEAVDTIDDVKIQLEYPQGVITSKEEVDLSILNQVLSKAGKYSISTQQVKKELTPFPEIKKVVDLPKKSLTTYKPLILIVAFISGVSLLVQYPFENFSGMLWMRHFMAGFFIVFAFFKFLNLNGFANSYAMYDVIAKRWKVWGFVYPFVELGLGVMYLLNIEPIATNIVTIVVLGVSSIGVIQSNLQKKKIKCACLGDVFNLPMSTVTIIEDLTMVVMAIGMLFVHSS